MPSLKSSSKGGSTLTLFASERKAIENVFYICRWLQDNDASGGLTDATESAMAGLSAILKLLPAPERNVKQEALQSR